MCLVVIVYCTVLSSEYIAINKNVHSIIQYIFNTVYTNSRDPLFYFLYNNFKI